MKKIMPVLIIIFLLAGCGGEAEKTSSKNKKQENIVLKKDGQVYEIKGIQLKMSQQQVKDLLGEPNSINSQGDVKTLEYGDITVGVEDKNNEYTGGVFSIIVNDKELYAKESINIGTPISKVKEVFGEPYKKLDGVLCYVDHVEEMKKVDLLFFEDNNGKVGSWGLINKWYMNE